MNLMQGEKMNQTPLIPLILQVVASEELQKITAKELEAPEGKTISELLDEKNKKKAERNK